MGMLIRSHQTAKRGDGYEIMHGGRCMRVFSARDYEGEANDGSLLSIEKLPELGNLIVRAQLLQSLAKAQECCRRDQSEMSKVFAEKTMKRWPCLLSRLG